eukprot:jgi/Botrbrau1/21764/Bobra.43_1s0154.1
MHPCSCSYVNSFRQQRPWFYRSRSLTLPSAAIIISSYNVLECGEGIYNCTSYLYALEPFVTPSRVRKRVFHYSVTITINAQLRLTPPSRIRTAKGRG